MTTAWCARVATLCICISSLAAAQHDDKPSQPPAGKPDGDKGPSEEQIARWAKLAEPGEYHDRLTILVGKWDLELSAPGVPASKGTAEYAEILGGRFITEHIKCTLGDQPIEWYGTYGYDNAKRKYIAVWMDNLGTGMDFAEGNNEGDVIQLRGEREEGGQSVRYKWIIRVGRESTSIAMLDIGEDGKDVPQMTIQLKRAK